ncbi:hypothetical protein BTVI_33821 [Pitangus sulphuratus]|nr:hypothetical protein BTVI_33821 [Pitangus sulphuratus]
MIFELSWESGEATADWKMKNIVPVFKKSKKEDHKNYMPVSLTSVPGKIMVKIILGSFEKHLEDNAVIGHNLQGFMRGKSCLSNLICFYDKVIHLADLGKPLDVTFLDFSKAFNTLSHSVLLDKMSSIQLNNHVIQWVRNWLTGGAQRVFLNGGTSDWHPVISGVPWAFIHSPVLFNVFINELDAGLEGILSKSDDNTKLRGALDSLEGREALQRDPHK